MRGHCKIWCITLYTLLVLVYYFMVQNKKDPIVYEYVKPEVEDIVKKAMDAGFQLAIHAIGDKGNRDE